MELPCVNEARKPSTRPKQWNKGGGQHITSSGVSFIASPTKRALLRRLLLIVSHRLDLIPSRPEWTYTCVSIAAFGEPVVPIILDQ